MYNKSNSGHSDSLEVGQAFQDFVCIELAKTGLILQNLSSKKYQFDTGENLQGWEIKYDARCTGDCTLKKCTATNQLSFEIAEKTKAENAKFIDSGILRDDNSWLYIQGNYHQLWIFDKKMLRRYYEHGVNMKTIKINNCLPTIRTFYMSVENADEWCAKKITF